MTSEDAASHDLALIEDAPASPEPEYLAFVSYKGGVGRSLSVSSCANLLARGGSNVLVIDFDIEAPSLPGFYGYDSFAALRGRKAEARGHKMPDHQGLVAWAVERDEHGEPLVEFTGHLITLEVPGPGSLRLLPTGAVSDSLLKNLNHFRWQAWMRPRETEEPWAIALASELRRAISELDPCPDFVLVDATAGLDAPAYRVLADLSDQALFLVTLLDPGEAVVFEQLRDSYEGTMRAVASRVPGGWDEAQNELLDSDLWKPHAADMLLLRQDPRFFGRQRATVPLTGLFEDPMADEPVKTPHQLTYDHIRMLGHLITKDRLYECVGGSPQVLAWAKHAMEQPPEDNYKLFTWSGGTIFNPSDPEKAANVSFRVATIRRIFNDIWRGLGDTADRTEAFTSAGAAAGFAYGESLRASMQKEKTSYEDILRRWCHEDSQVGFGDLRLLLFDPERQSGTITMDNVFLPPEKFVSEAVSTADDADAQILHGGSSIFSGYVRGVLGGLFEESYGADTLTVTLDWKSGHRASEVGDSVIVAFGPRDRAH